jgi:hypothetical protein
MFFRRKPRPEAKPGENGWTEQMIGSLFRLSSLSRDEERRGVGHADHSIHLVGYGHVVNKFEAQRMAWGWLALRGSTILIPAYVRFDVVLSLSAAESEDFDSGVVLPQPDEGADALARMAPDRSTSPRPRHQVGKLTLNGRGGTGTGEGPERMRGMVPVYEPGVALTRDEWAPVRECLEVARWRDGRGPTLSVRIEAPLSLDLADVLARPWWSSYPITRFWMESTVAFSQALGKHPVFADDVASGGIEQLF